MLALSGGADPDLGEPERDYVVIRENRFEETVGYRCTDPSNRVYDTHAVCRTSCSRLCKREYRLYVNRHKPCFDDWCPGDHKCKYSYDTVIEDQSKYECTYKNKTKECEDDWYHCDCSGDKYNSQCQEKNPIGITIGTILFVIAGIVGIPPFFILVVRYFTKFLTWFCSLEERNKRIEYRRGIPNV